MKKREIDIKDKFIFLALFFNKLNCFIGLCFCIFGSKDTVNVSFVLSDI